MSIGDRIQSLRKSKGISQEELADKVRVSRQAVSKWESEQSTPDIDKIILLIEYFETTTDYLLKGIEPTKQSEKEWNAMLFSAAGTILNAIGLAAAIAIWIEQQMSCSVGIGLVIMLLGTGIFLAGQIVDSTAKEKARYFFILPNIWILPFIPMACCFNFADGLTGGFSGLIAPVPCLGNSFFTYALYWIVYITVCGTACMFIVRKKS